MTGAELEVYLTQFLAVTRAAESQFKEAEIAEQEPNDATQDILHTAELCPEALAQRYPSSVDLIVELHRLREERRIAKQELEVTHLFDEWATENKRAVDKLDQTIGAMRKVLRRQPLATYRFKTGLVGDKDTFLSRPDLMGTIQNAFDMVTDNQITMDEWMAECAMEQQETLDDN